MQGRLTLRDAIFVLVPCIAELIPSSEVEKHTLISYAGPEAEGAEEVLHYYIIALISARITTGDYDNNCTRKS